MESKIAARFKVGRLERAPAHRRTHYHPTERLAILRTACRPGLVGGTDSRADVCDPGHRRRSYLFAGPWVAPAGHKVRRPRRLKKDAL